MQQFYFLEYSGFVGSEMFFFISGKNIPDTEEGSVILKVDWKEAGDSAIQLIVSVTDTGIGIKPEDIDKYLPKKD